MIGRYAPSPTGELHLGNLRTALLAWLFARAAGSRFLLRIEDLDPDRSRPEHVTTQLADLRAIGIDWDGEPVRQSERADAHAAALERLRDAGCVYRCFCSRREVREAASAQHGAAPEGHYPGTCRALDPAESARRAAAGERFALRLRAESAEVTYRDRLRGDRREIADDVVLRRRDGVLAYNLAVVVDDDEQAIEEVVRGDDLLPATAAQALLCDLLGIAAPLWTHVPLVLGPDGARLAKRHGAVTLADLARAGHDAADARAWMARSLGLAEPGEKITAAALVDRFDPSALPREPTTFADLSPGP
ncbi:MAG TPA: tRNA glutamyl-Q(34) synthetase GluQRS [Solirubrobacterales bacterium]|nr:tRNA glutamyl-Q(34) synthetase GluQRS [Solirubrobacterales bacterium]